MRDSACVCPAIFLFSFFFGLCHFIALPCLCALRGFFLPTLCSALLFLSTLLHVAAVTCQLFTDFGLIPILYEIMKSTITLSQQHLNQNPSNLTNTSSQNISQNSNSNGFSAFLFNSDARLRRLLNLCTVTCKQLLASNPSKSVTPRSHIVTTNDTQFLFLSLFSPCSPFLLAPSPYFSSLRSQSREYRPSYVRLSNNWQPAQEQWQQRQKTARTKQETN